MTPDIQVLSVKYLRGPNTWTYQPAMEVLIDIGELEERPSNLIEGFHDRLVECLPTLVEHRCSYGTPGGFLRRVREGTWPGHILEHVTLELQSLAGLPGGFGRAREVSRRGVYKVVVNTTHEEVTLSAFESARELVLDLMAGRPFDADACVARLRRLADRKCLGPSTASIVEAAEARGIPYLRLNAGNLVQLGHGAAQRRIWTAETDRTSAIAESISRDKDLTRRLLADCGVPVPEGRVVTSAEDAWEAAEDIGTPVVVKPLDGNHGRGVSTSLDSRDEVMEAYRVALGEGSAVVVERFIEGVEHRLLVVGDQLVAAARGDPAWVTGDGTTSVRGLIDTQLNADPRRGQSEASPLNLVRIDAAARVELRHQGLTPDSVPEQGRRVLIQRSGNVATDVTDEVHPQTARAVCLAARVVGLDIAGIDLVTRDISRPLEEQQGALVEVNAGPGLLMHLKPARGTARPVGRAIVGHLFPDGQNGRIPIIGITGCGPTTAVARLVAGLLSLEGRPVGLACADGLYASGRWLASGDCTDWNSAHRLLLNRQVGAAVFEQGIRTLADQGLAYDRCQVGVMTRIDPDLRLPESWIDTPERVFDVMRTQIDVVLPGGVAVLDAADPVASAMAPLCDGEVLFYARSPDLPVLSAHRAAGGRAVYLRDGSVVLGRGDTEILVADLPAGAADPLHAEAVLIACAVACALEIAPVLVRATIQSDTRL